MKVPPQSTRLLCSLVALAAGWLLNVIWYAVYNGWHDMPFWLFWTGIFCVIGWLLVGLPVVKFSEHVRSKPLWLVILLTGAAGAAIMFVPTLLWTVGNEQTEGLLDPLAWAFCATAFCIAAVTMAFYRLFLWLAASTTPQSSWTEQ